MNILNLLVFAFFSSLPATQEMFWFSEAEYYNLHPLEYSFETVGAMRLLRLWFPRKETW